ncbi:hypothetical protein O6P43_023093 [Quillaja saponaria]|uniref:Uncharacterized protein n=1 Tax=Quillaja saponaria TaxID=32244 RepID=A0AAD7LF39_QUISA|nr:hypothetical protein O6P43_023093 [Quillaja saponaria]
MNLKFQALMEVINSLIATTIDVYGLELGKLQDEKLLSFILPTTERNHSSASTNLSSSTMEGNQNPPSVDSQVAKAEASWTGSIVTNLSMVQEIKKDVMQEAVEPTPVDLKNYKSSVHNS